MTHMLTARAQPIGEARHAARPLTTLAATETVIIRLSGTPGRSGRRYSPRIADGRCTWPARADLAPATARRAGSSSAPFCQLMPQLFPGFVRHVRETVSGAKAARAGTAAPLLAIEWTAPGSVFSIVHAFRRIFGRQCQHDLRSDRQVVQRQADRGQGTPRGDRASSLQLTVGRVLLLIGHSRGSHAGADGRARYDPSRPPGRVQCRKPAGEAHSRPRSRGRLRLWRSFICARCASRLQTPAASSPRASGRPATTWRPERTENGPRPSYGRQEASARGRDARKPRALLQTIASSGGTRPSSPWRSRTAGHYAGSTIPRKPLPSVRAACARNLTRG